MHCVLIVEDDADINATLQEAFRVAGYDAIGVETGEAAFDEIAHGCPDLVLLDQMLPDIDGLEICRRLRAASRTQRVPIIFLTARSGEESRVKGLAVGADDYVTKPFSMQELVLRARGLLRRSSSMLEVRLAPAWLQRREQFHVWDNYANIHLGRGEWQECMELCRCIVRRCEDSLSPTERCRLYSRLARCAQELGDSQATRAWRQLADEHERFA